MSFLTAEWRKLAFLNYPTDEAFLQPYLPYGTQLDFWEGKCYVSLIGFMFMNTRLLGLKIPFHTNFEEVNLRFYVKRLVGDKWHRGVVFIKEMVPKPAITLVANTLYNEKYETLPMQHHWRDKAGVKEVEYSWQKNRVKQFINLTARQEAQEIPINSQAEFITEHYYGYARVNARKTNEYEVTHPRWLQYQVLNYKVEVDFALNYGPAFSFLNKLSPQSVMLAEGSAITIENKKVIL